MPTGIRSSRGQNTYPKCNKCNLDRYETTQHISQGCDAVKGLRTPRHNKIQKYLSNTLKKLGYSITEETRYTIGNSYLKPDLLVTKGNLAVIIDVQIVSDSTQESIYNLDRYKVEKYDIPEIRGEAFKGWFLTNNLRLSNYQLERSNRSRQLGIT